MFAEVEGRVWLAPWAVDRELDHAEPERVRLYVFTVQSLTKPSGKQGKKTHAFHESLGEAFYKTLQEFDDLVLFADEHHVYYGPSFSDAVRALRPHALVGLTATPHKKTPEEQLIYRYPLAAAIADRLVKTPVLVGRKDDRGGETLTKLSDGIRLLEAKRAAMDKWCALAEREPVNPILLVIAQTIDDAEEVAALVKGESFFEGRYAGSRCSPSTRRRRTTRYRALELVEDPESPVRIIVSVGMLKEGWDVKNVYVICSLRPLLSDVLTEQTLGRGLRLPWGQYTGVPLLDTLEVLAHDRYEALLKKTSAINEEFVDYRTRLVVRRDAEGNETAHVETTPVDVEIVIGERDGAVGIAEQDAREDEAAEELAQLSEELAPTRRPTGARDSTAPHDEGDEQVLARGHHGARRLRGARPPARVGAGGRSAPDRAGRAHRHGERRPAADGARDDDRRANRLAGRSDPARRSPRAASRRAPQRRDRATARA